MGQSTAFPVWANGELHPPDTPVISAEDQGFLLGLAVFDSLLWEDDCLYFLDEHVGRLRNGARELGLPWPPPWDPAEALRETAGALDSAAVLRITYSRGTPRGGPTMVVTPRPLDRPPAEGVRVLVASPRKLSGERLESVKSTNRLRNVLAREEAQAAGAWEALLADEDGALSEGTITNLYVVVDGTLRTPAIEQGCLGGIVRGRLLADLEREPLRVAGEEVAVVVDRILPEHLEKASEVLLTNSSGRVIPVFEVVRPDGAPHAFPGARGPVTGALRVRMDELERLYRGTGEGALPPAGPQAPPDRP